MLHKHAANKRFFFLPLWFSVVFKAKNCLRAKTLEFLTFSFCSASQPLSGGHRDEGRTQYKRLSLRWRKQLLAFKHRNFTNTIPIKGQIVVQKKKTCCKWKSNANWKNTCKQKEKKHCGRQALQWKCSKPKGGALSGTAQWRDTQVDAKQSRYWAKLLLLLLDKLPAVLGLPVRLSSQLFYEERPPQVWSTSF